MWSFAWQGLSAEQVAEASRSYAEGWSLAQLGERYECTADTVQLALLKAGVPMRKL